MYVSYWKSVCRKSSVAAGLLQALHGCFCPAGKSLSRELWPAGSEPASDTCFCARPELSLLSPAWTWLFWICAACRVAEHDLGTVSLQITSDSVHSWCFGYMCVDPVFLSRSKALVWQWCYYLYLQACNRFCALPCVSTVKNMLDTAQRQVFLKNLQAQHTAEPCQLVGLWAVRENMCDLQHISLAHSVSVVRENLGRSPAGLLGPVVLVPPASSGMMSFCPTSVLLFCVFRFGALGESPKSEMERNAWSHLTLPLPTQDYSPQYSLECLLRSIFKWLEGEGFPLLPGEAGSAVH